MQTPKIKFKVFGDITLETIQQEIKLTATNVNVLTLFLRQHQITPRCVITQPVEQMSMNLMT
jgi:hypothetical protein